MIWYTETYCSRKESPEGEITLSSYGESEELKAHTDNIGHLFRDLQKDNGRCVGKIYVDTREGTKQTGWVFLKRKKYTDCNETYLCETWVSLLEKPSETKITHFPKYI